jgi:hypothetical protein
MKKLFDTFWKEYPRKVGKKQTLDAWQRLKPSPELYSTIMEALSKQKTYRIICDKHNMWTPDFPHPVRWIKHERWEDEVPELTDIIKDSKFIYKLPKNNLRDER